MEQVVEPIRSLENDEETPPTEQLRLLINSHVKLTLSHRRTAKMLFDVALDSLSSLKRKEIVAMRDTYDRILRSIIARGKKRGDFADVDEKLAGFMIAAMCVRTRLWYNPRKGLSPEDMG